VNVEGGFVATSIGYGLLVEETGVTVQWARAVEVQNTAPRGPATFAALIQRIAKLRQDWLRDAIANPLEDVSFRYSIYDSGRGRDLQNQPLHNVARLGIESPDRVIVITLDNVRHS
jgi:hypothetical protein